MYLRKRRSTYRSINAYNAYTKRLPAGITVNWSRLPDKALLHAELKERIDAAIRHIPIQYRMPLVLHRIEGMSLIECSQILGLSVGTLKSRLHRAYLMVKDEIAGYFKDRQEKISFKDAHCGIWTKFVYDYVRGELKPDKRSSFHKHITNCPRCNRFLDAYEQAIRITGVLECKDLPLALTRKIETFLTGQ
jgi:hypothetical protein